jgi:hypothetical protein
MVPFEAPAAGAAVFIGAAASGVAIPAGAAAMPEPATANTTAEKTYWKDRVHFMFCHNFGNYED